MLAISKGTAESYNNELSELALEAAIATEELVNGQDVDVSAIDKFTRKIRDSIVSQNGDKSLNDVTLVSIYNRALSSATEQQFDDTGSLIDTLSKVLRSAKFAEPDSFKSPLVFRDFCLAMHGALLSREPGDQVKSPHLDIK